MRTNTVIALAVAAVVVYLVMRQRAAAAVNAATDRDAYNDVDWIPSREFTDDYWAARAGGTPSTAGSHGAGEVTPVSALLDRVSRVFGGEYLAWRAPNAATNPVPQTSFSPPGALVLPGPVSPGQPTPQSAVESSSPWLPSDLALAAPLAANPWFMNLSAADPFTLLTNNLGGGIDVEAIPAV